MRLRVSLIASGGSASWLPVITRSRSTEGRADPLLGVFRIYLSSFAKKNLALAKVRLTTGCDYRRVRLHIG